MMFLANDLYIGRSLDLYGEFSEPEVALFQRILAPGDTVLDVGANIGAHSLPLARLVGPTGQVLAFEPQRPLYYCLCGNVALNQLTNVVCRQAAVGAAAGETTVPDLDVHQECNFGGVELNRSYPGSRSYSVPVVRIDDLGLTQCRFVKVDVEGMEQEVLEGAVETLRTLRPLLYVEDDRPAKSPALRRFLWRLGYELYLHTPPLYNPGNFAGNAHNVFGRIVSVNLFCHPREMGAPIAPPEFQLRKVDPESARSPAGVRVPLADLSVARSYHQAGDVRRAEQTYRQILQHDPNNAQAWYLCGAACQTLGDLGEAVACMRQAVRRQPDHAEAHNHLGVLLAQQRQMAEAEASFRQALRHRPDWVEALNNLGLALKELGRGEEAVDTFQGALRCEPTSAEAHTGLGLLLAAQGKLDEAIASYRQALRYKPDHARAQGGLRDALRSLGKLDDLLAFCRETVQRNPTSAEAHSELGLVLLEQGQQPEAAACFREVLRLQPTSAEAHNNLGLALMGQGQYDEAIANYQQAIRLKPDFDQAHNNLGAALRRKGRNAEAEASCREAVRLRPDRPEAHNNLGLALLELGRRDEAVASLREALRLNPNFAQAYNNLGIAQWRLGQFEEAEASYRQALRLRPDFAESCNNLGNVLRDLGRFDEALAVFDQALRCKPDYADPHWNRSLVLLLQGELEAGWVEYEWRWQIGDLSRKPLSQPPWDGKPLEGRTILLYAEQGMGDTVQLIRYAPLVRQRGGRVLVECQKPLKRLLAGAPGIDWLRAQGEPLPPFDAHAALLSLPRLFGTTLANVPADVPYLQAEQALVEQWRRELASTSAFKVGIAWKGSSLYRADQLRSIPLAQFAPLAEVPAFSCSAFKKERELTSWLGCAFP